MFLVFFFPPQQTRNIFELRSILPRKLYILRIPFINDYDVKVLQVSTTCEAKKRAREEIAIGEEEGKKPNDLRG